MSKPSQSLTKSYRFMLLVQYTTPAEHHYIKWLKILSEKATVSPQKCFKACKKLLLTTLLNCAHLP
jgi:hypothetical protein